MLDWLALWGVTQAVGFVFKPVLEDLAKDTRKELDRLIAGMQELSEQELMDQVHRRVTLSLCGRCYADWIENPTG